VELRALTLVLLTAATLQPQSPRDAQRISREHVEITTYVTAKAVTPGTQFSIVVELTPKPGMHLYAPGAHTYKVVALTVDPQPFLTVHPLQYPASEKYLFEPLDEIVDVYQKPFRLVQDVTLESSSEARTALGRQKAVTITATLQYQTCDAKICFLPQSIPVRYRVGVRSR
jgi:hypothetical protein